MDCVADAARATGRALLAAFSPEPAAHNVHRSRGQWLQGVAAGPAGVRRYVLYRPPVLHAGERLPLVVMLHGCDQDAESFAASTRMARIASEQRFMVLYPEQDRVSNARGCWDWLGAASETEAGEASLLLNAVDQVGVMFGADRSRVAIAGLSSGATMAAVLAARYPQRFKAVVMHSGVAPGSPNPAVPPRDAVLDPDAPRATLVPRAIALPPLMVIQGDRDLTVAPSNGLAAAQAWAATTGAVSGETHSVERGSRYAANVTKFKRQGKTLAALVDIAGLGHAWSGGATNQAFSDDRGPDASQMVWAFAAKQFRA